MERTEQPQPDEKDRPGIDGAKPSQTQSGEREMAQHNDRREMMFYGTKEEMEKLEELLGRPGEYIVTSNPTGDDPEVGLMASGTEILEIVARHIGLSPERTRDWAELEYEDQQIIATIAAGNMEWTINHALEQSTIDLFLLPETGFLDRITKAT